MRKTIPAQALINYLCSQANSHHQTAENLRNDNAPHLAPGYDEMARAVEMVTLAAIRWQHGEHNSILYYHDQQCEGVPETESSLKHEILDDNSMGLREFRYPVKP